MPGSRLTFTKIYFAKGEKCFEHCGVRTYSLPLCGIGAADRLAVKFRQHAIVGKVAAFKVAVPKNEGHEEYAKAYSESIPQNASEQLFHSKRSRSVKGWSRVWATEALVT